MKIIKAGAIINAKTGDVLKNQALILDGVLIKAIFPWEDLEINEEVIDWSEFFLIPGLIDTHLHISLDPVHPEIYYDPNQDPVEITLRTISNAQKSLSVGVTTLGDCGAENKIIFPVQAAINNGDLIGPRILTSGNPIVPHGGHGADQIGLIASGVDELRKAVQQQAMAGANFIKVMATSGGGENPGDSHYEINELIALREEAEKHNLIVAAHAHGSRGISDCVKAGIQRIEHCTFYNGEAGFDFDSEVAKAIVDQGIIVSPTNVIDFRRIEKSGKGALRNELNDIWRQLLDHGVEFAASSDAGVTDIYYDDYSLIPELLVNELEMSLIEAIKACTVTAAKALNIDDKLGNIEVGKIADIVALRNDPLDNITAMREVEYVIKAGSIAYHNGSLCA